MSAARQDYMRPMRQPAAHMYHVPCKDSEQRAYFLRMLEKSFQQCEAGTGMTRP